MLVAKHGDKEAVHCQVELSDREVLGLWLEEATAGLGADSL